MSNDPIILWIAIAVIGIVLRTVCYSLFDSLVKRGSDSTFNVVLLFAMLAIGLVGTMMVFAIIPISIWVIGQLI
jgi:hypothetical protein